MGVVVAFPPCLPRVNAPWPRPTGPGATITILPVIRIERHVEDEVRAAIRRLDMAVRDVDKAVQAALDAIPAP